MIDWTRVETLREEVGAEEFSEVVDLFLNEVDAALQKMKAEKIFVWTVNTSAGLKCVKDQKIVGVITDKPRFARKKLIG